jgi:trans-aconitate methyltransferase
MAELWKSAEAYEAFMGRWSRAIAVQFVHWLDAPGDGSWLDIGCGTGALTRAILADGNPSRVVGVDGSEAFVAAARASIVDARARFSHADAQQIPGGEQFDAVVSGLVLNFLSQPAAAVRQMVQTTRPAGTVAAYVWDYADGMEFLRYFWDAACELDPAAISLDEGRRDSVCHPDALAALMSAELSDVEVTELVVPTHFASFDAYWQPFLGGVGSAPAYVVSLDEEDQGALRDRVQTRLPVAPDGSISLTARAWAVKGRRR